MTTWLRVSFRNVKQENLPFSFANLAKERSAAEVMVFLNLALSSSSTSLLDAERAASLHLGMRLDQMYSSWSYMLRSWVHCLQGKVASWVSSSSVPLSRKHTWLFFLPIWIQLWTPLPLALKRTSPGLKAGYSLFLNLSEEVNVMRSIPRSCKNRHESAEKTRVMKFFLSLTKVWEAIS